MPLQAWTSYPPILSKHLSTVNLAMSVRRRLSAQTFQVLVEARSLPSVTLLRYLLAPADAIVTASRGRAIGLSLIAVEVVADTAIAALIVLLPVTMKILASPSRRREELHDSASALLSGDDRIGY